MSVLTDVLAWLFPVRCVGCGVRGAILCGECESTLPMAQSPKDEWITSIFAYHDAKVKRLIWLFKYRNARTVAKIFAPHMAESIQEFLGEEAYFLGRREVILVPVPLSKKRLRTRGYNQAEILAHEIQRILPEGIVRIRADIVQKHRDTKPQADIRQKHLRLTNLGECFSVKKMGNGEVIILIDDVTTTGATLTTLRRALLSHDYKKIIAFTIAH